MITVTLSDETWGACLDAVNIRFSQWDAMDRGEDPCEERFELEAGEARSMANFYEKADRELQEKNPQ